MTVLQLINILQSLNRDLGQVTLSAGQGCGRIDLEVDHQCIVHQDEMFDPSPHIHTAGSHA